MARNMTFKVGDVVFPSGTPTCLGKIVAVRATKDWPGQEVQVKWRKKVPKYWDDDHYGTMPVSDWKPSHYVVGMEDYIQYRLGIIKRHKKRLADMKKWVP